MISDVLSDAVVEIDRYLNDHVFDDVYQGEMRARIVRVRGEMDALRIDLDAPPQPTKN